MRAPWKRQKPATRRAIELGELGELPYCKPADRFVVSVVFTCNASEASTEEGAAVFYTSYLRRYADDVLITVFDRVTGKAAETTLGYILHSQAAGELAAAAEAEVCRQMEDMIRAGDPLHDLVQDALTGLRQSGGASAGRLGS